MFMSRAVRTIRVLATRELEIEFDKIPFTYHKLTGKRLRNWLLTELAYAFKSSRVWTYPTHLQIEPSNRCNLRCPLCHVVTDNKPQGLLKLDDFTRIMDEVSDYILFLHFWGWGEPFLNPDFFSMIRYAKAKGVQIISSTNGHFFGEEENLDRVIDSGLDVLIVALDGTDPETYEKYRQQGDFEKVCSGIERLLRRRAERGATTPRINLRMLVTRENEHQVEEMKTLGRELSVDILSFKTLCSFDNREKWESIVPSDPQYRRFHYDARGDPVRLRQNPCKKPWNHPTVYRDGLVVPCDYYTGEEFSMGNAWGAEGGFARVWFSPQFRRFRARFARSERSGSRCDDCSLNYADVDRCVAYAIEEAGTGAA